jgi:hypothetical protein
MVEIIGTLYEMEGVSKVNLFLFNLILTSLSTTYSECLEEFEFFIFPTSIFYLTGCLLYRYSCDTVPLL